MLKFILFFCCATATLGDTFEGKIIGGDETTIEEHPYQISLREYGHHICGGSILNEDTIITAAHCTNDKFPMFLSIRAGSTSNKVGGQEIKVKRIIQCEQYIPLNKDYDLSILKLAESLIFNEAVQAIKLQDAGVYVPIGTKAIITGWGRTVDGVPGGPEMLHKVEVSTITKEECKLKYTQNPLTERMFCCTSDKHDACQGDSGGPLVAGNKLIGIVSWGKGCGKAKYPGVFTNVSVVRSWIDEHTEI